MQAELGRNVLGREVSTAVGRTNERVSIGRISEKLGWDRAEKDGAVK